MSFSNLYLRDWQLLPEKLDRLSLVSYLWDLFRSVVGIGIYTLSCISLGSLSSRSFGINESTDESGLLERLAIGGTYFLVGQGILAVVFLGLAVSGQLSPILVLIVLMLCLVAGLWKFRHAPIKQSVKKAWMSRPVFENIRDKIFFWLALSIPIINLLHATARISYDASAIYFSYAKITALTHRVTYFADNTFVASVFQTSIQYSAIIQLFGDQSARMFSWVCGVIAILFGLALGKKIGLSNHARLILMILMTTSTGFIDLMGDGKVDLTGTVVAIAAIYWMVIDEQSQHSSISRLLLIGFLIGVACVTRPFNAFLLGVFTFLFYLHHIVKNGLKLGTINIFVKTFFWIGLGCIGWGLYHLLVNYLIFGDPLAFMKSSYFN